MKKYCLVILLTLTTTISLLATPQDKSCDNSGSNQSYIADIDVTYSFDSPSTSKAMSVRNITVYMIKSYSSAKKSATYNSDNNTITVDGNTYSVKDNPEYGRGGKTGQYEYVAGGCYYFNL